MRMTHPDTDRVIDVADDPAPMYSSQGWVRDLATPPPGNASLAAWQEYARALGFAEDYIDGMTRNELRDALS